MTAQLLSGFVELGGYYDRIRIRRGRRLPIHDKSESALFESAKRFISTPAVSRRTFRSAKF